MTAAVVEAFVGVGLAREDANASTAAAPHRPLEALVDALKPVA